MYEPGAEHPLPKPDSSTCAFCGGRGSVRVYYDDGFSFRMAECALCAGTGKTRPRTNTPGDGTPACACRICGMVHPPGACP